MPSGVRSNVYLSRTVVLAVVVTALAAPAAHAAPETCHGQPATVVGTPGGSATGTDGDDVIVSNGADDVVGGAGDDTICVTAVADGQAVDVDAGPGRDLVDTVGGDSGGGYLEAMRIVLGSGADELVGGAAVDTVYTGSAYGVDTDTDRVSTGGGSDNVYTGQAGRPDDDDVDLGEGPGGIWVASERPTGVLRSAAQSPWATIDVPPFGPGDWVVDDGAGQATLDGVTVISWENLAMRNVKGLPGSRLRYVGTAGADITNIGGGDVTGVDMGAGDDQVVIRPVGRLRGVVTGGTGTDKVTVTASRVRADLRDGVLSTRAGHADAMITEVEDFSAEAAQYATVHGTPRPNHLEVNACRSRVRGGGGDDLIGSSASRGRYSQCRDVPRREIDVRLYGGPGDDALRGRSVPDHLYGGPGRDTADGGKSHDVCRAEHRVDCEA